MRKTVEVAVADEVATAKRGRLERDEVAETLSRAQGEDVPTARLPEESPKRAPPWKAE